MAAAVDQHWQQSPPISPQCLDRKLQPQWFGCCYLLLSQCKKEEGKPSSIERIFLVLWTMTMIWGFRRMGSALLGAADLLRSGAALIGWFLTIHDFVFRACIILASLIVIWHRSTFHELGLRSAQIRTLQFSWSASFRKVPPLNTCLSLAEKDPLI